MFCSACAQETPSAPCSSCGADPLLQGRYRLEERLGQGSSGATWRGVRLQDEAAVALKEVVFRRENADAVRRKLEREAAVLRQLHHPALPAFFEHFETESGRTRSGWLVMQLVSGTDLRRELERHRYSEDEVLVVMDELCEVLEYLHGRSPPVVHRDLKPSNVIRTPEGRLALVDFGAVRDDLAGETVAGTFGYMAPEQFAGEATPKTDLYGLGALAVALLTRQEPARLLDARGGLAWKSHASLSEPTTHLLDRLLAPAPAQRPTSAAEVRRLIRERAAVALPPVARIPAGKVAAALVSGVSLMGLGLAMVGASVLLAGGLWLGGLRARQSPEQPSNVESCQLYVHTFNELPCSPVELSVVELCPAVLDLSPCDLSAYYECMAAGMRCNDGFIDLHGTIECSPPVCPSPGSSRP